MITVFQNAGMWTQSNLITAYPLCISVIFSQYPKQGSRGGGVGGGVQSSLENGGTL